MDMLGCPVEVSGDGSVSRKRALKEAAAELATFRPNSNQIAFRSSSMIPRTETGAVENVITLMLMAGR